MDLRESLTVRTVSAMRRLADLEQKGKNLPEPKSSVLRTALRELENALEELRVASEQLNVMIDEMAEARSGAHRVEAQFNEFRNLLPIGCVITDADGQISGANVAAGDLLNVAPRHLIGKPLSLYMVDRDRFFTMINGARLAHERLKGELAVRPRERRPRMMGVQLGQTAKGEELVWFFQETFGEAAVSA
jgi:PAS domain-containing protein